MNRKELDRAKKLLRRNDLSVSEVAKECGFETLAAFSANFKYHEKISPQQYQEEVLAKRLPPRIVRAQALLRHEKEPVLDKIASKVGLKNKESMRQSFWRATGEGPIIYWQRWLRGMENEL